MLRAFLTYRGPQMEEIWMRLYMWAVLICCWLLITIVIVVISKEFDVMILSGWRYGLWHVWGRGQEGGSLHAAGLDNHHHHHHHCVLAMVVGYTFIKLRLSQSQACSPTWPALETTSGTTTSPTIGCFQHCFHVAAQNIDSNTWLNLFYHWCKLDNVQCFIVNC